MPGYGERPGHLPDPERFMSLVYKPDGDEGCWEWLGYINKAGYGCFHYKGNPNKRPNWHRAYRVAFRLFVGEVPDDRPVLDHLCRNRRCVNPKHLEPVTARENTIRGMSPPGVNYRKRTCKYGHPLGKTKNKGGEYPWRYCGVCETLRYAKPVIEESKIGDQERSTSQPDTGPPGGLVRGCRY